MKLYEYQGKNIFRENGIPVPSGSLLLPGQETNGIEAPKVVKVQVLTGGRGKAGGIKIWDGTSDLSCIAGDMFSQSIKGESVGGILIEEKMEIYRELYLSITFKGSNSTPVLIASAEGGMEIENVAKENPEKISMVAFDPIAGPSEYQVRYIAKKLEISDVKSLRKLIGNAYKVFKKYDATLIEINPLAETSKGLMALDSKINLDDKSDYRHKEIFDCLLKEQEMLSPSKETIEEEKDTITYVPLEGTVGLISDGAGTGMLTLDLINDAGGQAANFCELGGTTNADVMYKAMELAMGKTGMDCLIVVLIGGFNRMDHMAEGIIKYRDEHGFNVPVFIRMCGTMEDVGEDMMKKAGIPVYRDLNETVNEAVSLVGRG